MVDIDTGSSHDHLARLYCKWKLTAILKIALLCLIKLSKGLVAKNLCCILYQDTSIPAGLDKFVIYGSIHKLSGLHNRNQSHYHHCMAIIIHVHLFYQILLVTALLMAAISNYMPKTNIRGTVQYQKLIHLKWRLQTTEPTTLLQTNE